MVCLQSSRRFAGMVSVLSVLGLGAWASASTNAEEAPLFKDRSITMLIGSASGGGTDTTGRLVAKFLGQNLPGQPQIIVRNMPGAGGVTALNYIVQQTKPDGLLLTVGAPSHVDPMNYRKSSSQYDPSKFRYIGGIGRGGTVLLINKEARKRLYDKGEKPVIMGITASLPTQASMVTVWGIAFLDWNAKWVGGYPSTNEIMLALERGEIDMTTTGNMFKIQGLLDKGTFEILNQAGMMEGGQEIKRSDFGDAPLFTEQVSGKITDPVAQQAFRYWLAMNALDKWLALAPDTPDAHVAVYRAAYAKTMADPEFVLQGKTMSEDFTPMTAADVSGLVKDLVATPDEAIDYIKGLMRKQGLRVD